MSYTIREIDHNGKFGDLINLGLLQKLIPLEAIDSALNEAGVARGRYRKLNGVITIILLLALTLYPDLSISNFISSFTHQLRNLWTIAHFSPFSEEAFSQRRYQLGSLALKLLWQNSVKRIATPNTKGAFLFGRHLFAIDSTLFDLWDTAENVEYFGYPHKTKACPFAQARAVLLVECGSRAIIDAQISPCRTSERDGGYALLEKVGPGDLVLWDCGFHSYDYVRAVQRRGADFLSRLPASVKPTLIEALADGSYLAWLNPPDDNEHHGDSAIKVRLMVYTLDAEGLPGHAQEHRLISSLLDPLLYPAMSLISAYHERWQAETSIGQFKLDLGLGGILRSKKKEGVLQELYAHFLMQYVLSYYRHASAVAVEIDPDRISFAGSVILLREAISDGQQYIEQEYEPLQKRLLAALGQNLVSVRKRRFYYRVVKSKYNHYDVKREHHKGRSVVGKSFIEGVLLTVLKIPATMESVVLPHNTSQTLALRC